VANDRPESASVFAGGMGAPQFARQHLVHLVAMVWDRYEAACHWMEDHSRLGEVARARGLDRQRHPSPDTQRPAFARQLRH
jgi:hypothetical protein